MTQVTLVLSDEEVAKLEADNPGMTAAEAVTAYKTKEFAAELLREQIAKFRRLSAAERAAIIELYHPDPIAGIE